MNAESTILAHDLLILEEMAANTAAYLTSDALEWTIPRANMPRLTVGGYLMRQQRLQVLRGRLNEEDQRRLDQAIATFETALEGRIVRFEKRAHQELHARIGEWVGHLRDLGQRSTSTVNFFAGIADIRVVIEVLLEKLQSSPFRLEEGVADEVAALDSNLRARVQDHAFLWDEVWRPAYPRQRFWWLYACP